MKQNEKLSIRDFYSAWYGIACCLLLGAFFVFLAIPMLKFTTEAGSVFSPNGYAFIFGFSVNFTELSRGIVEVAKFNMIMAIPLILVALAMIFFLCSKFSVWFGVLGAASLVVSGILFTQVTNFDFYGGSILADYVNIIIHSKTNREPGYYLTFISLFVIAVVAVILMAIMRGKARSKYRIAKADEEGVGIASHYMK